MTRPLNNNHPLGSVTTSDLVVYQGPNIPCLHLCKGDTVSKVINKLATKFCNLLDSLGVDKYDFSCLTVNSCPPKTFQELIQLIITSICEIQLLQGDPGNNGNYVTVENIAPGEDCINGGTRVTLYDGITNEALDIFTICNGANGEDGLNGTDGTSGLVCEYGMFYGLTAGTGNGGPTDYASTVAVKTAAGTGRVPFPQDGPTTGIVRIDSTSFTLPNVATYEIHFNVHTTEPGQLQLELDGVALPETAIGSMNPTSGGHNISGSFLLTTTTIDSVLAVINPSGNSTALTIVPADGASTHANSQVLIIKELCGAGISGDCDCSTLEGLEIGSNDATYNTGTVALNTWFNTNYSHLTTDLTHTIAGGSGKYRFDFELYVKEEQSRSDMIAGVRINGTAPVESDFTSTRIFLNAGGGEPVYFTLFIDLINGDIVQPDFKVPYQDPSPLLQMDGLKLYITKVTSV